MYGNLYTTPAQYTPNVLKSLFRKTNKTQNNSLYTKHDTNKTESKNDQTIKSDHASFSLCMCIKPSKTTTSEYNISTSITQTNVENETKLSGVNDYDISAQHYMP